MDRITSRWGEATREEEGGGRRERRAEEGGGGGVPSPTSLEERITNPENRKMN